jgi:hypothetical protein
MADALFPNTLGKDLVNLYIGDSQAVLRSVFLSCRKAGQLYLIARKIAELPDFKRWNKTRRHESVLEYVSNPLSVFLVGLLTSG